MTQQPMGVPQAQGYAVAPAPPGQQAQVAGHPQYPGGQVLPGQVLGATGPAPNPMRVFLRSAFEGTPGRMRLFGALAALSVALFGLLGASSLWSSSGALDRSDHNTAQVVRVQGIYADLVRADADATNAFLVGGLEDVNQRKDYDDVMTRVATSIAAAAQAQPADGEALGALNVQVQTYAGLVDQARVYNRQGLPIGAQYLKNASNGLRASALPIVDALTKANTDRANEEFDASRNGVVLAVGGVLTLVVLIGVMVWLARRTHRYVNTPLTVATALALVALVLGAVTLGSVNTQVTGVQDHEFKGTVALAQSLSAAYDAKSNESLTLISRGSGSAFEKNWTARSTNVTTQLGALKTAEQGASGKVADDLKGDWGKYVEQHQAIRKLDDGGDWESAVSAAVASSTDAASANGTFTTFAKATSEALEQYRIDTRAKVTEPRVRTTVAGWALLIVCLGAALLSIRGVSQRLEEYR